MRWGATTTRVRAHAKAVKRLLRLANHLRRRWMSAMFPYIALAKDKTWQPGPYEGVELMILHKNETTGGVVVLRKFKAGHTIPAHTHPLANEWAYVLSGD